jgi:hypothetical protein
MAGGRIGKPDAMDKTTFNIVKTCFKADPLTRPKFASLATDFEALIRENAMKGAPVRDIGATIRAASVRRVLFISFQRDFSAQGGWYWDSRLLLA